MRTSTKSLKTLTQLQNKDVSTLKAYTLLSPDQKPARFVKLRIIQNETKVQWLLNLLFWMPLPFKLVYFFLKGKLSREERLLVEDLIQVASGIKIRIETAEVQVFIHII
jgi:hypothetical protein